jgi:hypothetical protein
MDKAKASIISVTQILVSLLTLAIVASMLVGPSNMLFFGNVIGNIVNLISDLGRSGLAGLIATGIILHLFGWVGFCSCSSK